MICPFCFNGETKVTDKRDDEKDSIARRRRECLGCGKRFTTYERVENINIIIIKKDGSRQKYDRIKLENGIAKACKNRPCLGNVSGIADQIELEIRSSSKNEIPSREIGELVMNRLKTLDKVAYMRFTSVCRSFCDLDSFEDELNELKKEN
ncbi:MAG: transcriptional regulator NrdR [Patescibacteria group bacterium]|jgi:transcriptional repressor NrdR